MSTIARNRAHIRVIVVGFIAVLSACGGGGDHSPTQPPPSVVATSIRLNQQSLTVDDGATGQLSATVLDQNGQAMSNPTGTSISWSSDAPTIASVSGGVVSGVHYGAAHVSATLALNGIAVDSAKASVTVKQVATALVYVSGHTASATVATKLPDSATVRVVDRHGDPVPGKSVSFRLTAPATPSGSVSPASFTTGANGIAQTSWTLSSLAGANALIASLDGTSSSVEFDVTGVADSPASITPVSGSGQVVSIGSDILSPLVAKVTDKFGNAVAGVNVSWATINGDGSVSSTPTVTAADGTASESSWLVSQEENADSVTASVQALAPAYFWVKAAEPAFVKIVDASGNDVTGQIVSVTLAFQTLTLDAKVYDVDGVTVIPGLCVDWTPNNQQLLVLSASSCTVSQQRIPLRNGPSLSRVAPSGRATVQTPARVRPSGPRITSALSPSPDPSFILSRPGQGLSIRGAAQGQTPLTAQVVAPVAPVNGLPQSAVTMNVDDPLDSVRLTIHGVVLKPDTVIVMHVNDTLSVFATALDSNGQPLPATWIGAPDGGRQFGWSTSTGDASFVSIGTDSTSQTVPVVVTATASTDTGTVSVTAVTTTFSGQKTRSATVTFKVQ